MCKEKGEAKINARANKTTKTKTTANKMKTWKIKEGGKEYKLAENADDLSTWRFIHLKEFLVQKETGVAIPSLIKAIQGFVKGFNANNSAEMLLTLYNYLGGLQKVEDQEDATQMIFTVICLEEGEDETKYDKGLAKEKLKRMSAEGLKQGQVATEVESFIKGSPILSSLYLAKSLVSQNG